LKRPTHEQRDSEPTQTEILNAEARHGSFRLKSGKSPYQSPEGPVIQALRMFHFELMKIDSNAKIAGLPILEVPRFL
jgi:hypothetical protein